jgi:hypothetical protein
VKRDEIMSTKKETLKSDVGTIKDFESYQLIVTEIEKDQHYHALTNGIKRLIEGIFDNYLEIGTKLNEINESNLYMINGYKTIEDYAQSEFNLSRTTTNNVMNIVKRFCDEDGDLLEKYEDYSFSNLVELLPVKDEDIDKFSPSLTVKETRTKKNEIKINKMLEKFVGESDIITTTLKAFDNYDFDGLEKESKIVKSSYVDMRFDFLIDFELRKDKTIFTFYLSNSFSNDLMFKTEDRDWHCYIDLDINDVNNSFKWIHEKIKNLSRYKKVMLSKESSKANDSKESDVSPGYYKLSNLKTDFNTSSTKTLLKTFISGLNDDFYYESTGSGYESNLTLYASGKRHKTKNPPLYEINHIDDPRETEVVVYGEDSQEVNRFKLFDDIDEYLNKKIETLKQTII